MAKYWRARVKHEEEEQQQQRWKTAQGLGLGQGFASVPRGVEQGLGLASAQEQGLASAQKQGMAQRPGLSSAATQVSGLKDGPAPGMNIQSGGHTESDTEMGQVPAGLVDGLEGSEEEWLRTLQAYLTFPDNNNGMESTATEGDVINTLPSIPTTTISDHIDVVMKGMENNNGMEPPTIEEDIGQFVGASWRASGQGLGPESELAPGQELASGLGLSPEPAQGQGLEPAPIPEGLPGLSVDELERLRTMERLLTLIGDPLGGQGLGPVTETAPGPGLRKETGQAEGQEDDVAVTTTDAITTATPPDITTTSWLPKVPGF